MSNIMNKVKGEYEYNELVGEASYTFTITDESEPITINGTTLTNGTYVIWYQTNDSIRDKLWLVNFYDLLGAGVWALGQEKVEVWDYYYKRLNEKERIPEEQIMLALLEEENASASDRIDFDFINEQIMKERNTLTEMNVVNTVEPNNHADEMTHKPEKKYEKVSFKKTIEYIQRRVIRKKEDDTIDTNNNDHIFRMEANY